MYKDSLPEIKAAIESLKSIYDDNVIDYLAGLYDRQTGAFYYSCSAQETEGYLPDLESTAQILLALDTFCEEGRNTADFLPEIFKEKLVNWVQGLEDPEDGYFYHPQWGKNIYSSRQGRDLGWARRILEKFNARAPFPTAYERLRALSESKEKQGENTITVPEYLRSPEAFQRWLQKLPWQDNPYSAGNAINAACGQINAAGYAKLAAEYLDSIQNPLTGLWGDGVNYRTVSALMKVASTYLTAGTGMRHIKEALQSCIAAACSNELTLDTQITFIYNPWCAVNSLRELLHAEGEVPEWFDEMLYENAAEMIRRTKEKLQVYKKADGGFSYMPDHSSATSQGVKASLGVAEGDVNATTIAVNGVLRNLNLCLGLKHHPPYNEEDVKRFVRLLEL